MTVLKISSCMAPLMDPMVQALAERLVAAGLSVEFVGRMTWRERQQAFDQGEIDLLWICGLPYVQRMDRPGQSIRLLAAPVIAAERYGSRPIYFSDGLVRKKQATSPLRIWTAPAGRLTSRIPNPDLT